VRHPTTGIPAVLVKSSKYFTFTYIKGVSKWASMEDRCALAPLRVLLWWLRIPLRSPLPRKTCCLQRLQILSPSHSLAFSLSFQSILPDCNQVGIMQVDNDL
jgi:hypothetical protein